MDLKKLLKFKGGDVFGLDLGSSCVKMVQLERNEDGFSAIAAGKMNITSDGDEGDIVRDMKTVRSITDCAKVSQVKSKLAVCGHCGPDVAVRHFKFPSLSEEEVPSAVALEAEQVCPFSMDEEYLDYQIIPDGSDSVRGVLVASTSTSVKRREKMVKDASLVPVLMDVDGLALLNCLYECEGCEEGKALAVLNVGHTYSSLVIAGETTVPFVRDINHAGEKIVKLLTSSGLSQKKVSEILSDDQSSEEESMLLEACLEDACKVLVDDVKGTLRYYGAQKKKMQIDTLYVCGGFAQTRGFVDILNTNLPVKVVLWNPFDKIVPKDGCPGEKLLKTRGPAFAVSAGLAMRSI